MARAASAIVAARAAGPADDRARIESLLEVRALVEAGWDPRTGTFSPDPDHAVLGYPICPVVGCSFEAQGYSGSFCGGCQIRWRKLGCPERVAFRDGGVQRLVCHAETLCLVCRTPGHERPALHRGLCRHCYERRKHRAQTVESFIQGDGRFPPALPRPTLGRCQVSVCDRVAAFVATRLCEAHHDTWVRAGRPDPAAWRLQAPPVLGDRTGRFVLRGLSDRIVAEVLFGVQSAIAEGRRTPPSRFRSAIGALARSGATSSLHVDTSTLSPACRRLIEFMADRVHLALSDPRSEFAKDVWDLRVWGRTGHLSFLGGDGLTRPGRRPNPPISQGWLRAGAKCWASDALAAKEGQTVRAMVSMVGLWSQHLRCRPDAGEDPSALGREDVVAFLARLSVLERSGRLSGYMRAVATQQLARFLRDCREMGLTKDRQPMAGLGEDLAVRPSDRLGRPAPDREDVGQALPEGVLRQLLSDQSLSLLETLSGPAGRAAVELAAAVGRRPGELCSLSHDCLDYDEHVDEDGVRRRTPVLVHDMPKVGKLGCRLPIHEREVGIIRAQQRRARASYPNAPTSTLALFPRTTKNPEGSKHLATGSFSFIVRQWADALPVLDSAEVDDEGSPIPFPRERVFAYAFRHTFAQRHADAGTPSDVLRELMGHDNIQTTLGYFRVTAKRKRRAQELLGPLQIDARGRLTRPHSKSLADSEVVREEIAQVAVPFGRCTEPSNVKAGGHACPFRLRCPGCEYFRTDPSYQAELTSYLADLLADREYLASAVPELAEWARRDATPSDEEIEAVRRLIRSNDEAVERLSSSDRALIDEAVATVRKLRAHLDTSFPMELRASVRQSAPDTFPTVERHLRRPGTR